MQATAVQKRKKRRKRLWVAGGVVIVLLVMIGFFLIRQRTDQAGASDAQTGDVVTAFIGDLAASATASGQVESEQVARLSVNSSGLVQEVLASEGMPVQAGDALVQMDTMDLVLQVAKAEQNLALEEANLESLLEGPSPSEVAAAEAAVASSQANLDELLAGPTEHDIAESEANIRQQQAAVASASAGFGSARDSISASSIASAEAELVSAQIAYDQAKERNEDFAFSFTHEAMIDAEEDLAIAQAKVNELKGGANQGSLNSASADISAAASNLVQARANHSSLLAGSAAEQIAAAEASLAQVQTNLANLIDRALAEDVTIAEAEVEQARLALADAKEALSKATIDAPFDSVVTAVYVAEGEWAAGEVVELVSDELKVVLNVDELDIGILSPGQAAIITLETWPDEDISGEIVSIAPSAGNSGDGLVAFDVQINLEEPSDLPILVGMTANARLITANNKDVLLVPNAAITADRRAGTYWVNKVTGELEGEPTTEKIEVTVGFKDRDHTQINGGLSEGDQVVVGELVVPTLQFGRFGGGD